MEKQDGHEEWRQIALTLNRPIKVSHWSLQQTILWIVEYPEVFPYRTKHECNATAAASNQPIIDNTIHMNCIMELGLQYNNK